MNGITDRRTMDGVLYPHFDLCVLGDCITSTAQGTWLGSPEAVDLHAVVPATPVVELTSK